MFAPIALFCYKRLDTLKKTVEALQKNELASDSILYIFSDGPKEGSEEKVQQVRDYIKTINGFKEIKIEESLTNKGLANSIIYGVTKIVNEYGRIIVIEDDLVTNPYFLKYMNEALDMYEKEEGVGCIQGYNFPLKKLPKESTFFTKDTESWGWATWKRSWKLFNPSAKELLDEVKKKNISREFDKNDSYPFTEMLELQTEGKVDSWAIRWYASTFLNNKLSLCPSKSLVKNIGFGVDSTHCAETDVYDTDLDEKPTVLTKLPIRENKQVLKERIKYFHKVSGEKGNFILKRYRCGYKRTIVILGFIKFSYSKRKK